MGTKNPATEEILLFAGIPAARTVGTRAGPAVKVVFRTGPARQELQADPACTEQAKGEDSGEMCHIAKQPNAH
jgi:hypothetical protein